MADLQRWAYTYRLVGDDPPEPTTLDFAVDGRKATLAQFRAATVERFRDRPEAMFSPTSAHGDWREILERQTPLDPALFR